MGPRLEGLMAMAGAVEKGRPNNARSLQSADQRPLFHHFPSLIRPSPKTPSPDSRNSRLQNAHPWKLVSVEASMEHPSFSTCRQFAPSRDGSCLGGFFESAELSPLTSAPTPTRRLAISTEATNDEGGRQSSYSYTAGSVGDHQRQRHRPVDAVRTAQKP